MKLEVEYNHLSRGHRPTEDLHDHKRHDVSVTSTWRRHGAAMTWITNRNESVLLVSRDSMRANVLHVNNKLRWVSAPSVFMRCVSILYRSRLRVTSIFVTRSAGSLYRPVHFQNLYLFRNILKYAALAIARSGIIKKSAKLLIVFNTEQRALQHEIIIKLTSLQKRLKYRYIIFRICD